MAKVKKIPFVPVSAKILDAVMLRDDISARELRIIMLVWRLTYGWHKKWAEISYNTFSRSTGIVRRNCVPIVQTLVTRKIIKRKQDFRGKLPIFYYKFQKDYDRWKPRESSVTHNTSLGSKVVSPTTPDVVSPTIPLVVSPTIPVEGSTPIILKKDKERKDKSQHLKKVFDQTSPPYQLSKLLLDLILNRRNSFKKPDLQKWAVEMDRILRLDKRDPCETANVIEWCQADAFWQNNILSTAKLRKQYDQLALKMKARPRPTSRGGQEYVNRVKEACLSWIEMSESNVRPGL